MEILNERNPRVQAVMNIQDEHTPALMRIPGVAGTATGLDANGELTVKVFTQFPGVRGIPAVLRGVPVEVEVTGMFKARLDTSTADRWTRPVPIGVSTGHPDITAGTVGCRVWKKVEGVVELYALSNNHVYANGNDAAIEDLVLQPGPYDGGTLDDAIGWLHDFEPIKFDGSANYIDAAIAVVDASTAGFSTPTTIGYGTPSAAISAATLHMAVQKVGRTTGYTKGTVSGLNATVDVCYETRGPFRCVKLARFVGQITMTPGTFSAGGDSGSLIVTDDGLNSPVALLFAGSDTQTIANPIDAVLSRFDVTVDDGSAGQNVNPPAAPSALTAEGINHSEIRLSWTDNSENETRFEITRTDPDNHTTTLIVGANITSYTDSGLKDNAPYSYIIKACNSGGCTPAGSGADASTLVWEKPTATFMGTDVSTIGNWIGQYGAEGYDIVRYKLAPSYGSVSIEDDYDPPGWLNDEPFDERPLSGPDKPRFTACYFDLERSGYEGDGMFYFDVNLDNHEHAVSLYCLDWDPDLPEGQNRIQSIDIVDAVTETLLHSVSRLESFQNGIYLTWNIKGHVHIIVTWIPNTYDNDYDNAVVSGIFFDPPKTPPPPDAPPTVSVAIPSDGDTVLGNVTISASASDDAGVTQVEFFVDDSTIGVDTDGNNGWLWNWDTTSVQNGNHTLTAVATDTIGQTGTASITVNVDNTVDPPAEMLAPSNLTAKALPRQRIDLQWSDNSNNEDGFNVYRNGSILASVSPNTTSYRDNTIVRGQDYSYYVTAYSGDGESAASNTASATAK